MEAQAEADPVLHNMSIALVISLQVRGKARPNGTWSMFDAIR